MQHMSQRVSREHIWSTEMPCVHTWKVCEPQRVHTLRKLCGWTILFFERVVRLRFMCVWTFLESSGSLRLRGLSRRPLPLDPRFDESNGLFTVCRGIDFESRQLVVRALSRGKTENWRVGVFRVSARILRRRRCRSVSRLSKGKIWSHKRLSHGGGRVCTMPDRTRWKTFGSVRQRRV